VKGNIITNFTDEELVNVKPEWRHLYKRVWDITDLAVPPVENSAFFVTTNLVITPNQTRGECPELHDILPCRSDLDCKQFLTSGQAHGIPTGICNKTTESCILSAWCPLEEDVLPLGPNRAVLEGSKYFTVLIKNMVKFPKFNVRRHNIQDWQNSSYLATCHNSEDQPFCPIFTLGHILEAAGCNYRQVAVLGLSTTLIDLTIQRDFRFESWPGDQISSLTHHGEDIPRVKLQTRRLFQSTQEKLDKGLRNHIYYQCTW